MLAIIPPPNRHAQGIRLRLVQRWLARWCGIIGDVCKIKAHWIAGWRFPRSGTSVALWRSGSSTLNLGASAHEAVLLDATLVELVRPAAEYGAVFRHAVVFARVRVTKMLGDYGNSPLCARGKTRRCGRNKNRKREQKDQRTAPREGERKAPAPPPLRTKRGRRRSPRRSPGTAFARSAGAGCAAKPRHRPRAWRNARSLRRSADGSAASFPAPPIDSPARRPRLYPAVPPSGQRLRVCCVGRRRERDGSARASGSPAPRAHQRRGAAPLMREGTRRRNNRR